MSAASFVRVVCGKRSFWFDVNKYPRVRDVRWCLCREMNCPQHVGRASWRGNRLDDGQMLDAVGCRLVRDREQGDPVDFVFHVQEAKFMIFGTEYKEKFDEDATVFEARVWLGKRHDVDVSAIEIKKKGEKKASGDLDRLEFRKPMEVTMRNYVSVSVAVEVGASKYVTDRVFMHWDLTLLDLLAYCKDRMKKENEVSSLWRCLVWSKSRRFERVRKGEAAEIHLKDCYSPRNGDISVRFEYAGDQDNKTGSCCFRFGSKKARHDFPLAAKVTYLRVWFCRRYKVPLERVTLREDSEKERELDLSKEFSKYLKGSEFKCYVSVPRVDVVIKCKGHSETRIERFSVLRTVWELKDEFCKQRKETANCWDLYYNNQLLEDELFLCDCSIVTGSTVEAKETGIRTFSFSTLDGDTVVKSLPLDRCVRDLCPLFEGNVAFEYDSQCLDMNKKLRDIPYKPWPPISVVMAPLVMKLQNADGSWRRNIDVTDNMCISDVIEQVKREMGKPKWRFVVKTPSGQELKPDTQVTELDLSEIFTLERPPFSNKMKFRCTYEGKNHDFTMAVGTTLNEARKAIAEQIFGVDQDISLYEGHTLLAGDSVLKDKQIYQVPVRLPVSRMEFNLVFECGGQRCANNCKLRVAVDAEGKKKCSFMVRDLLQKLGLKPDDIRSTVSVEGRNVQPDQFFPDKVRDVVICVEDGRKDKSECLPYNFKFHEDNQVLTLKVGPNSSVRDVKRSLLEQKKQMNRSLSTLTLKVLGNEMQDDQKFNDYCLPIRSVILVEEDLSTKVKCAYEGNEREYYFSSDDNIYELKQFVSVVENRPCRYLEVFHTTKDGDVPAGDESLIRDFDPLQFKICFTASIRAVKVGDQSREVCVPPTWKVADVIKQLCEDMKEDAADFSLYTEGRHIESRDTLVSLITTKLELRYTPGITFSFNGIEFTEHCDFSDTLENVLKTLSSGDRFANKDEADLIVKYDPEGAEAIDKKKPISEICETVRKLFVIECVPEQPTPTAADNHDTPRQGKLTIADMSTTIPKECTFEWNSGMSMRDLMERVRATWKSLKPDLVFAEADPDTFDILSGIPFDAQVASVASKTIVITTPDEVGEMPSEQAQGHTASEQASVDEETPQAHTASVAMPDDNDEQQRLREIATMTIAADTPVEKSSLRSKYLFSVGRDSQPIELEFGKGATIEDAITELALRSGTGKESLALLWGERPLKEAYLLERLQLGGKPITVSIKQTHKLLFNQYD